MRNQIYATRRRFPFGAGIRLIRGAEYVTVVVTVCFTVTLSLGWCTAESSSDETSSSSSSSVVGQLLDDPADLGLRLSVDDSECALLGLGGRPRKDLLMVPVAETGAGYGVAGVYHPPCCDAVLNDAPVERAGL